MPHFYEAILINPSDHIYLASHFLFKCPLLYLIDLTWVPIYRFYILILIPDTSQWANSI